MNVRYLRLTINAIASGSVWQVSRLDFVDSSDTRFSYPNGTTVTPNNGNFPSNEQPKNLLDGNTGTKACCNSFTLPQILTIDMQSEALDLSIYNRWQWYTANDTATDPGRNLKSFTMEVSVDGTNWLNFTSVVNGSYTTANYSLAYRSDYVYYVNAIPSDAIQGSVTGSGFYENNSSAIVEAIANQGYEFVDWTLDGYTQLEYIESTGTQYIDTGVKLSINSRIESRLS